MSEIFAPPLNPVINALAHYLNKPMMASGSTKKAIEVNTAEQVATTEAYSDCIALMLSEIRERKYAAALKDKYLPMVTSYDVQRIISAARAEYRGIQGGAAEQRKDITEETWEKLMNLIPDEACDRSVETAHRKAVLDGTEQPTESDTNWLLDEQSQLSVKTKPYSQALEKLGVIS